MKLRTAIEYMNASAPDLSPALSEREVSSFVIDSREVEAGDVFFALSQPDYKNNGFNGEFEDATKYCEAAFNLGAAACVIRPDRFEEYKGILAKFEDRIIFVEDVIAAFQQLAHGVYKDWGKPVVAITGSAGKTTAKELTAHVLACGGRKVLKNIKNFNNGLGHPLTVLNLAKNSDYDVAVLEMGMSTPMNEIRRLCAITPPDVAVELNVLPVHVEHLGSIENVAKAKAELVEGMKAGGTAVLNADDPLVLDMRRLSKGSVLTFGMSGSSDIRAENVATVGIGRTNFRLVSADGSADVNFPLNGRHNILNALAAAAVGTSFEMTVDKIAECLETVSMPSQRGEILRFAPGFVVINDSYNSNPAALLSMVETLNDAGSDSRRRIVVAGEMLELGSDERSIHLQTGGQIARAGVDMLIGVRGLARQMVEGAKAEGLANAVFTENSETAGDLLRSVVLPGDIILVKGSRGVRTENVVRKLLDTFELEYDARHT